MIERIAEPQAVGIAEFLYPKQNDFDTTCWSVEKWDEFCLSIYGNASFRDYLYSAKGERALMDRLEKLYIRQEHWPASIEPDSICYRLTSGSFVWMEYKRVYAKGRAATRTHALLLAVIEMLKEVKG
jgi:hypothetical protein